MRPYPPPPEFLLEEPLLLYDPFHPALTRWSTVPWSRNWKRQLSWSFVPAEIPQFGFSVWGWASYDGSSVTGTWWRRTEKKRPGTSKTLNSDKYAVYGRKDFASGGVILRDDSSVYVMPLRRMDNELQTKCLMQIWCKHVQPSRKTFQTTGPQSKSAGPNNTSLCSKVIIFTGPAQILLASGIGPVVFREVCMCAKVLSKSHLPNFKMCDKYLTCTSKLVNTRSNIVLP